jgi:hypothetical protein
LEAKFQDYLGRLQADKEQVADFPKVAAREAKQGKAERDAKKLKSQLEEQKKLKASLLMVRTAGEISSEEFQEANAAFRDKIYDLEEKLRALSSSRATADSFVRFAELQITDMANVWRLANPEQRERVQNLLFQGGLDYSQKSGFLNRSKSSLFCVLETVDMQEANLVDLIGIEPMTSSMP